MRRLLAALLLAAAATLWVAPSSAFDAASFSRGVGATVVADGDAFDAIEIPACAVPPEGGACLLRVRNHANATQSFAVSLPSQPAFVTGYAPATFSDVAPGDVATVTVTLDACGSCADEVVSWTIAGESPGALHWRIEGVAMEVAYGAS